MSPLAPEAGMGRQHRRTGGIRVTQKVLAGMTMTLDGMEKIP